MTTTFNRPGARKNGLDRGRAGPGYKEKSIMATISERRKKYLNEVNAPGVCERRKKTAENEETAVYTMIQFHKTVLMAGVVYGYLDTRTNVMEPSEGFGEAPRNYTLEELKPHIRKETSRFIYLKNTHITYKIDEYGNEL